jgi:hypothetical protein
MTRRYSARIPFPASVMFSTSHGIGTGHLYDLSVPGCRLETRTALYKGQTVNLQLMGTSPYPLLCVPLAVVRWVESNWAGLEFIVMSPHDQTRLRDLVSLHSASSYLGVSDAHLFQEEQPHHA